MVNQPSKVYRDSASIFGLSRNTKNSDLLLFAIDYMAKITIKLIVVLTKFKNKQEISDFIKSESLEVPDFVLDIVRFINSNKFIRHIVGTNSVLYCKNHSVKTDLDNKELDSLEFIKVDVINYNNFIKTISFCKTTVITDFFFFLQFLQVMI